MQLYLSSDLGFKDIFILLYLFSLNNLFMEIIYCIIYFTNNLIFLIYFKHNDMKWSWV